MSAMLTEAWLFAATTPRVSPPRLPTVRARLVCPETGGVNRVRMVVDPVDGRPAILWCERFDQRPMACAQDCLAAEQLRSD